jgi:hypothetical protein
MTTNLRYCALFLFFTVLTLVQPAAVPAANTVQPISITLPESALLQTIQAILPLPLEQQNSSKKFQGTIVVDSISKLAIRDNLISLQGQITGRDMEVTTNIGGQNIKLKLGQLVLPVTCDIGLRFDAKSQTLFLTPQFQNPTHGNSNSAKTLLPMLNGLSREYPLKLDQLAPFMARVGSKTIVLRFKPVAIRAGNNALFLSLRPAAIRKK